MRPELPSVLVMTRLAAIALLVVLVVACRDPDASPSIPVSSPTSTSAAPSTSAITNPSPTTPSTTPPTTPPTTRATTSTSLAALQTLTYSEPVAADFPTVLTARPGDEFALLAERAGAIHRFEAGAIGEMVGEISELTITDGERGLLGLVRHPEDDTRLFIHYSDTNGDTTVSEFAFDGSVDIDSERVLLTVDQPAANHNGGMIQFGPDGAIYLGLGDGGGAGDPFGNGQNTETLLGGIVRLDPDSGDAELWQYGLRNPWRFWIDGDDIWIGDVGQRSFEEIDLAPLTASGLNYGWPIMEAAHCFGTTPCDTEGLTLPLVEVARGDGGTCSITGGVVYRGTEIPELDGRFLFSDYCAGYLRSVDRDGGVVDHTGEVGQAGRVVSFGVDGSGEVYVLTTGEILPLEAVR